MNIYRISINEHKICTPSYYVVLPDFQAAVVASEKLRNVRTKAVGKACEVTEVLFLYEVTPV